MPSSQLLDGEGRSPPALDDTSAEAAREAGDPPGVPAVAAARLAVCPYCHAVSELDPMFPEPVRLMVCWRCAEQHKDDGEVPPAEPRPAWLDPPTPRWQQAAGGTLLILLGLAFGYAATQLASPEGSRRPVAEGTVSGASGGDAVQKPPEPAAETAASEALMRAERALALPTGEPVSIEPTSAGPTSAAPVAAVVEAPRAIEPRPVAAPARAPAPVPAPVPNIACTSGAVALGLCTAPPPQERPQ
jgi:hypothetical protein